MRSTKMKKIFIDCGANNGMSVDLFEKNFSDHYEYEIHCFECNPVFAKTLKQKPNITFHNKAVWIKNEELKFYLGPNNSLSSSLIKEKITGNLDIKNPIIVQAIDLAEWIKTNYSPEDYIILKLDVEGVEYDILPHLIETKTLHYINELYGEIHLPRRIKKPHGSDIQLINLLANHNFTLKEWCAEKNIVKKHEF